MMKPDQALDHSIASAQTLALAGVHTLDVFYTPLEARFERITRLACRALNSPVAAISLFRDDRVWFKSVNGWNVQELPADKIFCSWAVSKKELLIVEDTRLDPNFKDHPLVIEAPKFRFYAGYPLRGRDGTTIGELCVYDTKPRTVTPGQIQALRDLGQIAQKELLTNELCDAQSKMIAKLGAARRQASIDSLTRVWNRRVGLELLRDALEQAISDGTELAVCMVDVDCFKKTNDELGHQAGDQVLRKIATTIVGCLRGDDSLCRYGGDEFLLILKGAGPERLKSILERIGERVSEFPINVRSGSVSVSVSIGAALSTPGRRERLEALVEKADQALYRCKNTGGNSVDIASCDQNDLANVDIALNNRA